MKAAIAAALLFGAFMIGHRSNELSVMGVCEGEQVYWFHYDPPADQPYRSSHRCRPGMRAVYEPSEIRCE